MASSVFDEEYKKNVLNRFSRAYGHLGAIRRMAEEHRDCEEILIQLLAVRSALNNLGKSLLGEYLQKCTPEDIEEGNAEEIEKLKKAIDLFICS